ncbi:hypothetical protein [Methylacidimicrobium tartarophylax]|uniref:Uncharacterized protein n=1 Tax=Methylacidimicrobium tartarophylax TaxID=1041768 RepID=A0A5E6MBB4_9BACT|nr:hypothetical protein [Methylacidimicrobium tartarophylax]VVM05045.1 hypothetical protein MAMT_00432 [Methylacidimicrobium tartarophylax]
MNTIFGHQCLGGVLSLWLTAAVALAQDKPSLPLSPEAQALIQRLATLRMPETLSFLQTADPKLLAETVRTPEGHWAMDLAYRWSTPHTDRHTREGKFVVRTEVLILERKLATLPIPILDSLLRLRGTLSPPQFSDLPDEEREQILDTQDAVWDAWWLAHLTPEQREATYELQDLEYAQAIRGNRLPESQYAEENARVVREYYELFTRWGPEKFHQVLEDRWSAKEFLQALRNIWASEGGELLPVSGKLPWKLSAMPSWFWEEIAEFAKGPNLNYAIAIFPPVQPIAIAGSQQSQVLRALNDIARALHDRKMIDAVYTLSGRIYAAAGFPGNSGN